MQTYATSMLSITLQDVVIEACMEAKLEIILKNRSDFGLAMDLYTGLLIDSMTL